MTTILKTVPFDATLLPLVIQFDCAEKALPEIWEEEINDWIKMDPVEKDGALHWMGKGTQVWLYASEDDEVVGYGALCQSRWPDPKVVEQVPKIKRMPISLIPAVGINRHFQGRPDGAAKDQKYSTKIMNHLVFEARQYADRQPFLGLYVHPQNEKAIRLYQRMKFVPFSQTYLHETAGVEYISMILKLADYPVV